jgi:hypothetical protein
MGGGPPERIARLLPQQKLIEVSHRGQTDPIA